MGVRGPFGTSWPLVKKGCDVLVIAGGVGLARSALGLVLSWRTAPKTIEKSPSFMGRGQPDDMMYKKEMEQWKRKGLDIEVTRRLCRCPMERSRRGGHLIDQETSAQSARIRWSLSAARKS